MDARRGGRRICRIGGGWNREVVLTDRHRAGMAEAPGVRPYDPEQASRDGQLSDTNHGQAPDRPTALPDR
jgi:hypothetical protein